jgi:hypothetical protein
MRMKTTLSKVKSRIVAGLIAMSAMLVAIAPAARGAIVYFDVNPDRTVPTFDQFFSEINIGAGTFATGTFTDPRFRLFVSGESPIQFQSVGIEVAHTSGSFDFMGSPFAVNDVLRVNNGSSISSGLDSWTTSAYFVQEWDGADPSTEYYAGLRLDAGGGSYNYGWVGLTYDNDADSMLISGFAFESVVDTPVVAGAGVPEPPVIPEPGTMVSMVLGIAALARLRARTSP